MPRSARRSCCGQVVEPGILLVEPLHRDRTAIAPAVPALGRLFRNLDVQRVGVDEPGQALGFCAAPVRRRPGARRRTGMHPARPSARSQGGVTWIRFVKATQIPAPVACRNAV